MRPCFYANTDATRPLQLWLRRLPCCCRPLHRQPAPRPLPHRGLHRGLGAASGLSPSMQSECCTAQSPPCVILILCAASSLQAVAERCKHHPDCTGFTWREQKKPELVNASTGVLKGGPPGQRIDPRCERGKGFGQHKEQHARSSMQGAARREVQQALPSPVWLIVLKPSFQCRRINWNPGLSMFLKEDADVEQMAPLDPQLVRDFHTAEEPAEQSTGLSTGVVAAVAVGATATAAVAAGTVVWWARHRRRRRASPPQEPLQLLPSVHIAAAGAASAEKDSPPEVVQLSGAVAAISTPRRWGGGSPGRSHAALLPPPLGHSSGAGEDASAGATGPAAPRSSSASAARGSPMGAAVLDASSQQASMELEEVVASRGSHSVVALVARLLDPSSGWQETLVPESAISFVQGPNGRPVVLGQGG